MTVKPTISLTDQGYAFAKTLVEEGKYASVSAVLQHGLRLVENEEEKRQVQLEALRRDLDERDKGPFISSAEMKDYVQSMLTARRDLQDDETED